MDLVDINESDNIDNKNKKVNIKVILLVVFVIIPLLIGIIFYNVNIDFKNNVNGLLSKMPGSFGQYFKGTPTEEERLERIDFLADHFIKLEPSVAADKIYIIKKDNQKLYSDIIRGMNRISSEKTEEVVLRVRDIEMRKDLLASIYEEAIEDNKNNFSSEVSRVQGQSVNITVQEIERKFSSKEFLKILKNVSSEKMGEILYYTDPDIRNYIMDAFDLERRMRVELEISKIASEKDAMYDLAKYYETKPIEEMISTLGSTNIYDYSKLATIYRNMSVVKSAEILSEIEDDEFIEELFTAILVEDSLMGSENQLTRDISRTMEFVNEYKDKILKLVKVYGEMRPSHVGEIAEEMMENDETVTIFDFNLEETYELSDKVIIIDILSEVKRDQLSEILNSMKVDKAAKLTELLAKPKEKTYNYDEGR